MLNIIPIKEFGTDIEVDDILRKTLVLYPEMLFPVERRQECSPLENILSLGELQYLLPELYTIFPE